MMFRNNSRMHVEIDKHDSTWIEEYVGRLVACNMTSGNPSRLSWIPRIKHPRWVLRDDGTALELNDTATCNAIACSSCLVMIRGPCECHDHAEWPEITNYNY